MPAHPTITYLAGLSGDGTSNGALSHLVGKTITAVLVIGVGVGVVLVLNAAYGKLRGDGRFAPGGGRRGRESGIKNIVPVGLSFLIFVVLVIGAYGIVRMSGLLSGGLFG
ncbi:Uncharacterised protein [Mycobacteroides abscessus subsp. massiliense]|uniref:hypothetical protein n=1 Tax=Mycobacteroides abscessus TaxID=36809 RepID=UPI0009A5E0FB|nr:hypothetical protein [Mycobacteroides abscessus]MDO3055638.1 hypothetical protein [Mycobacteroides abscessus subsp. massiliense]SLC38435.1 Uncharacterised protein [Mycobacteroides abscessus subsp. massiliense]SLH30190.1 Uncharacterised protein [Mycobacteroides abscessus subsp. massiliense]SLI03574.1 Uncharacterised protein [Mycobacteroides abscessus subsp. massiliense]